MANCAFLGLGVMGFHMAGHLASAGHTVSVWNRTQEKADKWAKAHDGTASKAVAEAVDSAEFIFLCVGEDKDVFAVMEEVLPAAKSGAIIVDHTTASDACAKQCYADCAALGLHFIDAPISGGEAGAVNGQLTVMCGGDQDAFDKAKPIIDSFAKAVKLMGPSGAGQLTKMVNQICIAGLLQGLSEAVYFAKKAGLNVEEVVGAIGKGAAQSWQMDNRALTMAAGEFNHGFAVDWMRKDLGIVKDSAKALGIELPVTELVDQYYADVQEMGGNRWDTSSLIQRLYKA